MCNLSEVIREEGIEIGRGTYVGLEEGLNWKILKRGTD